MPIPPEPPLTLATTTPRATPPGGISGRRVTTWVVVGLLTIGVALSFILWTYNRLDMARANSANVWRKTTHALDVRYRVAEQQLTDEKISGEISADFQQRFELAIDRFRTTSIVVNQVAAAEQVEQLLSSGDFSAEKLRANPPTEQLLAQLDEFNQLRQRERVLRQSLGGKMLEIFLPLPPSTPFQLAR